MPSTRTLSVAAILLLLTAIVVILVSGVVRKSRLDAEARDLAVEITQAVFTAGADRLIANAHSLMLADQSPRQLGGYIDFANRQLGALQRIESIAGDTRVSLLPMGAPPGHRRLCLASAVSGECRRPGDRHAARAIAVAHHAIHDPGGSDVSVRQTDPGWVREPDYLNSNS